MGEADRSLRELDCRPFHFHFVRICVLVAVSVDPAVDSKTPERCSQLLALLHKEGLITNHDISVGLRICVSAIADLELDVGPKAGEWLRLFIERAKQDGFLDKAWVDGSVVPAGKDKEKA